MGVGVRMGSLVSRSSLWPCASREAEDAQTALVLPRLVLVVSRVGEQVARGVPRDRVHRSRAGDGMDLPTGLDVGNVDLRVLGARGDEGRVVREGDCAHRPLETPKRAHAHQLLQAPQTDKRVRAADSKILAARRELDAVAVSRVRVQRACGFRRAWLEHLLVAKDLDSAAASGQEELLATKVPRHFVHLEGELDVLERLRLARLDDRDVVVLVAHRDVLPVGAPPNIDVLALGLDRVGALAGACVPYAHSLVARGGPKHLGLLRVPPQLIDGVLVALKLGARGAARRVDGPNAHRLVDRAGGELLARTVPRQRVHLLLVAEVLLGLTATWPIDR